MAETIRLEQRTVPKAREYRCIITKKLDEITGIADKQHIYGMFHHYVLADKYCKDKKCLAIRIPGRTIGAIFIDNNTITKVTIDRAAMSTYPADINDQMQEFVGMSMEWN